MRAAVDRDLAALRGRSPLVHCMTNIVVTGFTANVLLSAGAAPAMIEAIEESAEFAQIADALLINLGTVTAAQAESMAAAAQAANSASTPWVLDPVAAGAVRYRTKLATDLLAARPAIIRGNGSEILSLAGADGAAGKGVDSLAASEDAVDAARALARTHGCAVAVSGAVDHLTDGESVITVDGGHELMTKVTGVGCALGAVMAAFLAVSDSPLQAAVSASAVFGTAGRVAAGDAAAPGSFAVAFLDALFRVPSVDVQVRRS
ncbi:MAG TPA: hydroxyethylthiazole kinase [Mycobacteriales bacterium]|nr:hydroxyethylthiazole kinase [Mycobacteriales bacterium]